MKSKLSLKEADTLIDTYKLLADSLKVSVKIGRDEVVRITVNDLISKRNAPSNNEKEAFDTVLRYYLTEDEFKTHVLGNKYIME